ncbi:hypothetical protein [Confluentibacter flavum]|uniref:Uncharacterized protein n=1 Tax=Confluentibacter flavum TaxID=1909700 RepID=A0A2N3HKN8_9FLAO|nr:hypothetical protein [Confluentibacter flavum]PKQ45507.1 hypothetical protein CSW08_07735 [Confluentibacter flavum]
MIITILLVIIIAPLVIQKIKWKEDEEKIEEAYTETSIKYIISIFFSIVASTVIALKANIPASSGHGGFIYIIGPGFLGILVLIAYLVCLSTFPEKKVIIGITAILINLSIGIWFMFS